MGKNKDEDIIKCSTCEKEMHEDDVIHVRGKPYCDNCYKEAEEFIVFEEDYDDNDDDDDDDDDDNDDDDD
ncbi:hypothetical protein LCGC14_1163350 [marine sediment metagenome]|uniref:LIM zinc-binding domain-containing protein n=1 Tax=marine sediment metagenome TaxID=412755 RepID=A0A0F9LRW5_9ZZZZ